MYFVEFAVGSTITLLSVSKPTVGSFNICAAISDTLPENGLLIFLLRSITDSLEIICSW